MKDASCRFRFHSPLGVLSYCWDGQCCRRLRLADDPMAREAGDDPVAWWLQGYFGGEYRTLPPLIAPFSPFQRRLREALWRIPSGEVRTYGQLAMQLHTSARALGQALGANPLPLLVPCHRIVAVRGPGGFSCGLVWKLGLLALEGAIGCEKTM